jgi:hypothetical protein
MLAVNPEPAIFGDDDLNRLVEPPVPAVAMPKIARKVVQATSLKRLARVETYDECCLVDCIEGGSGGLQ